jgi:hypothetical protein
VEIFSLHRVIGAAGRRDQRFPEIRRDVPAQASLDPAIGIGIYVSQGASQLTKHIEPHAVPQARIEQAPFPRINKVQSGLVAQLIVPPLGIVKAPEIVNRFLCEFGI